MGTEGLFFIHLSIRRQRVSGHDDSRANKTLTYAYSPAGLLNLMLDSDGNRTDYLYDPVGRLTGLWAPNYDYVSFGHDAGGRLTEKRVNSVDAQYTYNADNTLASLTNKLNTTTISSHVYTYDALGNRQTQAETVNGSTLNYTYAYDALNRLTQVQNGTPAQQQNFSFDPIGNRLTKSLGQTSPTITAYVHDAANQLKEIHSGSATGPLLATLTYDADGNLKTRSDTGLTFTYDALNRLTQATQSGQPTQVYGYDDEGRRIQKTVGGTATNYSYSGQNLIAEYASTWGSPSAQYTNGPMIDNVISRITPTATQYFHQDGLNSVMAATNNSGGTDATQRFDAWGNKVASTGTTPHYGYTGREPDETGLIYYRARYYDPTLGRFTQRDPIGLGGGMNRYRYVYDNPLGWVDPSGTAPGDAYPTVDAAGANAVNDINYQSVKENREYAGRVYQNPDGTYSYTPPNPGTNDSSVAGPVPPGTTNAGDYHTHGAYDPRYDNEHFSPTDMRGNEAEGKPGYLGTPEGIIKKYDPATDRTKNLPYPESKEKESSFSGEHGGGDAVGNIFMR